MGENSEVHLWINLENKHTVSPLYCAKSIVNILNSPLCITFSQSWYRHFLTKVSFRIFQIHNFVTFQRPYNVKSAAWKVPEYGVFAGLYFPIFWLNTETYGVNLRIQSKCGKMRTRKNSVFGHLSRSDCTAWKLAVNFPSNWADLKIVEIFFCCVIIIMFIMFIINVTVNGWQCQYPSLCHRDSSILLLSVT